MESRNEVTHTGIIREVDLQGIKVSIVVNSGCVSCQIKGSCNMAEQTDKEIYIECDPKLYKPGQQVVVRLKSAQGLRALFWGYILPLIILVACIIISSIFIKNEGVAGMISLLLLLPYYVVLYLFRNKIKKKFSYFVNPLN